MSSKVLVAVLGGVSCLLFASLSQAQCEKDTDCKGERVCEAGTCVSPAPSAVAAPAPAVAAAPVAPAAPPPAVTPAPIESEAPSARPRRDWKRHSTGMMAGGIVMVSFVPIALMVALVADLQQSACENGGYYTLDSTRNSNTNCGRFDPSIYGGLISGVVLLGAGIPMIVIGSKREPLGGGSVGLAPWATPDAAGLRLRLDM